MAELAAHENIAVLPTIHIISDSVGVTAQAVARAASSQFGVTNPNIEVLPKVDSFEDIEAFFVKHHATNGGEENHAPLLVFFTLVDFEIRDKLLAYADAHSNIVAVDLLSNAVDAIAQMSGLAPSTLPGGLHVADQAYFNRIEAVEFTIAHDDGRNPQDLTKADIVLAGVSRSSKTPLSIYLSQQGYKVANVPLDYQTEPPHEIFDVEPSRLFGLITTPDVLVGIRKRRLGNASGVASQYADPEYIYKDLEKARTLMRKLGAIVVHTDNRAVEETAQEILRYYELAHPRPAEAAGEYIKD